MTKIAIRHQAYSLERIDFANNPNYRIGFVAPTGLPITPPSVVTPILTTVVGQSVISTGSSFWAHLGVFGTGLAAGAGVALHASGEPQDKKIADDYPFSTLPDGMRQIVEEWMTPPDLDKKEPGIVPDILVPGPGEVGDDPAETVPARSPREGAIDIQVNNDAPEPSPPPDPSEAVGEKESAGTSTEGGDVLDALRKNLEDADLDPSMSKMLMEMLGEVAAGHMPISVLADAWFVIALIQMLLNIPGLSRDDSITPQDLIASTPYDGSSRPSDEERQSFLDRVLARCRSDLPHLHNLDEVFVISVHQDAHKDRQVAVLVHNLLIFLAGIATVTRNTIELVQRWSTADGGEYYTLSIPALRFLLAAIQESVTPTPAEAFFVPGEYDMDAMKAANLSGRHPVALPGGTVPFLDLPSDWRVPAFFFLLHDVYHMADRAALLASRDPEKKRILGMVNDLYDALSALEKRDEWSALVYELKRLALDMETLHRASNNRLEVNVKLLIYNFFAARLFKETFDHASNQLRKVIDAYRSAITTQDHWFIQSYEKTEISFTEEKLAWRYREFLTQLKDAVTDPNLQLLLSTLLDEIRMKETPPLPDLDSLLIRVRK